MRTSPSACLSVALVSAILLLSFGCSGGDSPGGAPAAGGGDLLAGNSYDDLLTLFEDWREFVRPNRVDGVPDYSASAMAAQQAQLPAYRARLAAVDLAPMRSRRYPTGRSTW